jgi:hypothetical protein
MTYNGQAHQDEFVLRVLNQKRNGFFLEIGSNHPININNSYLLEKDYGWTGIMVEYDASFLPLYQEHRPNSIHVINDATKIDYRTLLESNNMPVNMDYLQIDLEVSNGSTLSTLEKLNNEVFDTYKFATVTFEHDIYASNFRNTRLVSRQIFESRGYVRVFDDIHNVHPRYVYEDWYVHPELVNMDYITRLQTANAPKYMRNRITGKSIDWKDINYLV